MNFRLPKLTYSYNALEPYIDTKTMETHHGKHHAGYVDKLNAALKGEKYLQTKNLEQLLSNLHKIPTKIRTSIRNNGGGHYNHSLFWKTMSPRKASQQSKPNGKLIESIDSRFGSFENFKDKFSSSTLNQFGSGWTWLIIKKNVLDITSTANQDSPIMRDNNPILGIDVWEHAYYLKYQNRRADYIKAWWNVVDWNEISNYFNKITK